MFLLCVRASRPQRGVGVGPEFRFWNRIWLRRPPIRSVVSPPCSSTSSPRSTHHRRVSSLPLFTTRDCASTSLWCSPLRVSYQKPTDEFFRSMERSRCDEIGLSVQGEVAIQNIQASSFKPYHTVAYVCLCVLLIFEEWQRPFREQSHGRRWDLRLATGPSQHLSMRNASG